jgi:hypothetical protein
MCIGEVSSPIACLLEPLAASPFLLAPERRDELLAIVEREDNPIEIVFDDENVGTLLSVLYKSDIEDRHANEIWFGVALAERLWAYSYFYTVLLRRLEGHQPGDQLDLAADAELAQARDLLRWAHDGQTRGASVPWPDHLPKPEANPSSPQLVLATEAFLCIGGWVLLHELGHVANGHGARRPHTNDDYEAMEFEADDWASSWMLSRWSEYSENKAVLTKRSLGAAFALAIIASLEAYNRTYGGFKHPDPPERLLRFLGSFVPEGDEESPNECTAAWYCAMVLMQLHLENAGKTIEKGPFETYRKYLLAAAKALG